MTDYRFNYFLFANIIFLMLLSLLACKPALKTIQRAPSISEIDKSGFTFYIMEAAMDNNQKMSVILVQKSYHTGALKAGSDPNAPVLLKVIGYQSGIAIDSTVLIHPLFKHYEYINEEDNFTSLDTLVSKSEFFFRLQGHHDELRLTELLGNNFQNTLNLKL